MCMLMFLFKCMVCDSLYVSDALVAFPFPFAFVMRFVMLRVRFVSLRFV